MVTPHKHAAVGSFVLNSTYTRLTPDARHYHHRPYPTTCTAFTPPAPTLCPWPTTPPPRPPASTPLTATYAGRERYTHTVVVDVTHLHAPLPPRCAYAPGYCVGHTATSHRTLGLPHHAHWTVLHLHYRYLRTLRTFIPRTARFDVTFYHLPLRVWLVLGFATPTTAPHYTLLPHLPGIPRSTTYRVHLPRTYGHTALHIPLPRTYHPIRTYTTAYTCLSAHYLSAHTLRSHAPFFSFRDHLFTAPLHSALYSCLPAAFLSGGCSASTHFADLPADVALVHTAAAPHH